MAFELVKLEAHPQLTTWCDIWSYGSTMLEVRERSRVCSSAKCMELIWVLSFFLQILSGKMPYSHRKNDIQVFHEVIRGIRPPRDGIDIPHDIWSFISSCWSDTPDQRPTVNQVRAFVDKTYRDTRRMGLVMGSRQNSTDIGSDFLDL